MRHDGAARGAAYRADIDGLRALAVAAVVVYHAFPGLLPGGFAGVDVFFAISGFLITGIVVAGFEAGRSGLAHFYARRIRRIFPALLVVLLATYALGWFALFPDEFRRLGRQLLAGAGFAANFAFWSEAGYFDTAAPTKPLLHLWSLGIEEQFYIVWPLLLYGATRLRANLLALTLAGALLSLGAGLYAGLVDPVGAFYAPWNRAWELLLGGALALRNGRPPAAPARGRMALAGAALIAAGFALLDGHRTLPPGWALLPVLGTCLVLHGGPGSTFHRAVLGAPPLVWLGRISYPLYLWHWPLLSFAYILRGGDVPPGLRLALVAASVVLAGLTYVALERPVRRAPRSALLVGALGTLLAVVGWAGFDALKRDGLSFRFNGILTRLGGDGGDLGEVVEGCGLDAAQARRLRNCVHDRRGPSRYALLGDSKGEVLYPGLVRRSTPFGRWLFIGGPQGEGNLVPVLGGAALYARYTPLATLGSDAVIADPRIRVVVLAASTRGLFALARDDSIEDLPANPNYPVALDGLERMVAKLVGAGKKVVIPVDNPSLPDPLLCIRRTTSLWLVDAALDLGHRPNECSIGYRRQLELSQPYRKLLNAVLQRHPDSVRLFDTLPVLCDAARDRCASQMGDRLLYRYSDHISDFAAGRVAARLVPLVEAFDAGRDDGPHRLP